MKIALLVEANSIVGMGHAVRCSAIVKELKGVASFYVISLSGGLEELFPFADHFMINEWGNIDWGESYGKGVDAVIADIPFYYEVDWDEIKYLNSPLVVLDDHGGDVRADVIVNGTVVDEYHNYHLSEAVLYCGGRYSVIRDDFLRATWDCGGGDGLLIVVGSGEEAKEWIFGLIYPGSPIFFDDKIKVPLLFFLGC